MAPNSLFAILLRSPWWISFAVAGALIAGVRLLLPDLYAVFSALPFIVIGFYTAWQQLRAPSAAAVARRMEALRGMSGEEFSGALEAAFRRAGYTVSRPRGAGAVDLELSKAGRHSLVCCRRWKAARSGVEPLRELYEARVNGDAHECIYVCAGELTENAMAFSARHDIRLLQGAELDTLLR